MSVFLERSRRLAPVDGQHSPVAGPGARVIQLATAASRAPFDPLLDLKMRLHERLLHELDVERLAAQDTRTLRASVEAACRTLLATEDTPMTREDRAHVVTAVADEITGLGPLQTLLEDPTVSEVMVNRPDQVYFERGGVLYLSEKRFKDSAHILRIIEKVVAPLNRRIDESSPMVDARLPDGSRVNAIIPPLAIDSPAITIRKFSQDPYKVEDLIRFGTLAAEMADLLEACVQMRLNMVVSGGTGAGKTTLLNVLSSFIPLTERVITIEDPAELQMRLPHVIRLETRPANIEGEGQVTQRDLVRNALRMRPDRIVIGEVRAGEAFDMLQAMNTGHDGSLTTVHANSPRDALSRIENLVLMAGLDLPARMIREQAASAINVVVQIARMRDGTRRVTHVSEVVGMEGQTVTLQDIFVYQVQGMDEHGKLRGAMRATGLRPKFAERFADYGRLLPASLFELGAA